MPELHETLMGRRLIEGTLPEIAEQLKRIADALENKEIKSLIKQFPNDMELGKQIRNKWQK
jgi:hypothetical protein